MTNATYQTETPGATAPPHSPITTTSSKANAPESTSEMTWSQDALRTAEQILAQLTHRPAVVLMSHLQDDAATLSPASQVAEMLTVLENQRILFIDAFPASKTLPNEGRVEQMSHNLDKVSFLPFGKAGNAESVKDEMLRQLQFLEEARRKYSLILIHGAPFSFQDSFTWLKRADFAVVLLKKGISSMKALQQVTHTARTITSKPLGIILLAE